MTARKQHGGTAFSARRAVLGGRGRLAKQARFVAGKIKRQDAAYVDVLVKARGKRIGPRSRVRLRADNLFGPCGWGAPLWPRNASNASWPPFSPPMWRATRAFSATLAGGTADAASAVEAEHGMVVSSHRLASEV